MTKASHRLSRVSVPFLQPSKHCLNLLYQLAVVVVAGLRPTPGSSTAQEDVDQGTLLPAWLHPWIPCEPDAASNGNHTVVIPILPGQPTDLP